jgi:hypothetical protein
MALQTFIGYDTQDKQVRQEDNYLILCGKPPSHTLPPRKSDFTDLITRHLPRQS